MWRPAKARNNLDAQGRPTVLLRQDLEKIEGVSLNSLQPATQAAYGSGLLAFHVFCDQKKIPEDLRAPVNGLILKSFVATLAGIYSAAAISNYTAAVRAWHFVHGIEWNIGDPEMDAIIKGAKQMAPQKSTRKKREPITTEIIEKIRPHFSDNTPLDVAVFACLTSAFWSTARLGELTVPNLLAFAPESHVKRSDLGESTDRNGLRTTTIRIPKTKANPNEGEVLYWAKQNGDSDPEGAMKRHLKLNDLEKGAHLFGYRNKEGKGVPMTKTTFMKRLTGATIAMKLPRLQGHSIRIGSTLEYLLRGLPFKVMKAKGRWNSDAFHEYLRDHAQVLAPYMQDAPPDVHDRFLRIAIPTARG